MADGMKIHHHEEKHVYLGFHTGKFSRYIFHALKQTKTKSDQNFSNAEVSFQGQHLYYPDFIILVYRVEDTPSSLSC